MRPVMPLVLALTFATIAVAQETPRVVVVTATEGFRHDSIPNAERFFGDLAARTGWFHVVYARATDELHQYLSADALRGTSVVVFANTSGEIFNAADRRPLLQWIAAGGAFIGVHSATDTFHGDSEYIRMIGGEFDYHPAQTTATVIVEDRNHPSTAALESPYPLFEEFYFFRFFQEETAHVLLALHASPEDGAPGFFPLAWHQRYGAGRVFYTAIGHRQETWESPWFREHLTGAVAWALAPVQPKRRRAASK